MARWARGGVQLLGPGLGWDSESESDPRAARTGVRSSGGPSRRCRVPQSLAAKFHRLQSAGARAAFAANGRGRPVIFLISDTENW